MVICVQRNFLFEFDYPNFESVHLAKFIACITCIFSVVSVVCVICVVCVIYVFCVIVILSLYR